MAVAISNTGGDIAGVAASGNVASYTGVGIGAAASDRIVVVCVGTELASSVPTACTIDSGGGAVSMTAAESATQGNVNSHIFYLGVATGTTATIAVTFGATNPTAAQNKIAAFRVVGASATPFDTGQVADTDADPISSGALAINADGGGIAICSDATDTTARTWTGFNVDLDVDAGAFRFSTGTLTGVSTPTITVSGGNNEDGALSWIIFNVAGTATTMTANPGAFTESGQPSVFQTRAPGAAGAFTEAGQPALFRMLAPAGTGAYTLTGQDVTFRQAVVLAANTGTYTLSGQPAVFRTSVPVVAGTFNETGQSVLLKTTTPAAAGAYTLSGQPALFRTSAPAATGAFVLTGQNATLGAGNVQMAAGTGSFVLGGQNALFTINGAIASGTFSLAGQAALFRTVASVSTGVFTLTGQDVTFRNAVAVTAQTGAFNLTGVAALFDVSVSVGAGAFVLTGQGATLTGEAQPEAPAHSPAGGTFSRSQYRKLKEEWEREARQLAQASKQPKEVRQAAKIVAKAIATVAVDEAAQLTAAVDLLKQAANRAETMVNRLADARAAIRIAEAILDDDEEEAIALLVA